ncbi:MAG: phosphate ABC transporter substrate-binding protein PstS family protein [Actinomycetota bacterium]
MISSLNTKRLRLLSLVAAVSVLGVACAAPNIEPSSGEEDGGNQSGEIVVSGSSTVEPITGLVAEKFQSENPSVAISVDGPGTGDGFELFCNGETDISDASRAITPEEAEVCEQNSVEFIELKVAIDGLSVITSPENDQVDCLDFKDLYALLGPESQGFTKWSDANELGEEIGAGHTPYPDVPLTVTAPGEESGTYDSFVEIVIEDLAEERGQKAVSRPDYQASPNDNVIIEGITGSPTSLGWVGLAFYVQNEDAVKALEVEGGDGCVAPSADTVSSGEYPIARDLFIYVSADRLEGNEALSSFVDFYMSDDGLASVNEVGYVDLAESDIEATHAVWDSKELGTREG